MSPSRYLLGIHCDSIDTSRSFAAASFQQHTTASLLKKQKKASQAHLQSARLTQNRSPQFINKQIITRNSTKINDNNHISDNAMNKGKKQPRNVAFGSTVDPANDTMENIVSTSPQHNDTGLSKLRSHVSSTHSLHENLATSI